MTKQDNNNIMNGKDQEINNNDDNRKRNFSILYNNGGTNNNNNNHDQNEIHDHDFLTLSLSVNSRPTTRLRRTTTTTTTTTIPPQDQQQQPALPVVPHQALQLPPTHSLYIPSYISSDSSSILPIYRHQEIGPGPVVQVHQSRPFRARRNSTQTPGEGRSETVPALWPWATTRRATVHSFDYLRSKNLTIITGDVHCKKCDKQYEMAFDLEEKFPEVANFIKQNKISMHDRAPAVWMNPVLPTCEFCNAENSAKPVIPEKKKQINWLFLLLGQLLGCCTLEQLKYFCKHTKNHRTGAKDRVLYLTYLGLCKQLFPVPDLFDR